MSADHQCPLPLTDPVPLGNDYSLALMVYGDGTPWPWLVSDQAPTGRTRHGCCCTRCAPHEQAGPWPARTKDAS